MKYTLLLTALTAPITIANLPVHEQYSFWERVAEKWGIGFVGLSLFCALAWWTTKRDAAAQAKRDAFEESNNLERTNLQKEIRDLNRLQLTSQIEQATRLEHLVMEGNKVQSDLTIELRNLASRVNCPRN